MSAIAAADIDHLRRLPRDLLREGYIDAYCTYGMLHLRFAEVRAELDALPDRLRSLVLLFFLGEPVARLPIVESLGGASVAALVRLGVLIEVDERIHTAGLVLLPFFGQMLFIPKPLANPQAYFGDDSAVLAARLSPPRTARCLDLCAGPGTQALRCAALARSVVAVEINPVAVACAELNFVLNSVEDRAEIRGGDLFGVLRSDERFDFVVANPPTLPFSPELPFPEVAAGGDDGLHIVRRILEGLPSVLAPSAVLQLISCSVGDADGPLLRQELAAYSEQHACRVAMTVPARTPLTPGSRFFEVLVQSCAYPNKLDPAAVRERVQHDLSALGATHLYTSFTTISYGAGPQFTASRHFAADGGFWLR